MRIVAARLNHETNTFSPLATPIAAFGPDGPTFGSEAFESARGTRTGLGAFIDLAAARGDAIEVAVNATANPSGTVDAAAYEELAGRIVEAVRGGCDAVLLDLHGAMVAQGADDGEGELLRRIRAVAPEVPLAVALDLHGNITQAMVDTADAIVGFKTYPHVDMYETGAHAARLVFDWIDGGPRPFVGYAQPPLLSHTLRSASGEGAMQRAVEAAKRMEAGGLLAATVFAGFSLADFRDAGLSIVTVGRGRDEAQRAAAALARQVWAERDGFFYASEPLPQSVARALAMRAPGKPVLLLDHGDNVMAGGTCDTTTLLEECLRQGMRSLGVGPLADPVTVAQAFAAGKGSRIRVALGNKLPLGLPLPQAPPFDCDVTVGTLGDGRFRISGPIYTGETWAMGRTAVLQHEAFTVVATERPMEPLDLAVFTSVGVDPRAFDFLLLKSRMYCRPTFVPISSGLVECDSRGVCSSDYGLFRFTKLRRPIYPLDPQARYGPSPGESSLKL